MKIIRKTCASMRKAEQYQDRLYKKYEHVRLIRWPSWLDESGVYVWEVR